MRNSPDLLRLAEQVARDANIWHLLYPKMYQGVPPYYMSPKLVALLLVDAMLEEVGRQPFTKPIAQMLTRYSMPFLWLDKKLMEAMSHTTPPAQYDLLDLKLPMPAMTLLPPLGGITTERDGCVEFISYARYEAHDIIGGTEPHIFICSSSSNGILQAMSLGSKTSKVDMSDLSSFTNTLVKYGVDIPDADGNKMDNERNQKVLFYLINSLLIMNSRPELIETAQLMKRVQHKSEQPREFWTPNWLGRKYYAKHESTGTHASPRLHWVRGFWRQQAIGSRKLHERSLRWIEPFLRGGA